MTDTTAAMDVIQIGEPGCYATTGHVDLVTFTEAVRRETGYMSWGPREDDDWADDYEPARHTWMVVKAYDDHEEDEDGFWYREVVTGTPDAEPYTLIACVGCWTGPTS